MTAMPELPDPVITALFTGRYSRIQWPFQEILLSEVARIQTRDAFCQLYSPQEHFLAGLFWDKVMTPVLAAFYAAQRQLGVVQAAQSRLDQQLGAFAGQARNATTIVNQEQLVGIGRQEARLSEERAEFNRLCAVVTAFFPAPAGQINQPNPNNENIIRH